MAAERLGYLTVLARLGTALVLALPLAWERQAGRHLGLRTVPLVSIGACGYVLVAIRLGEDPEASTRVLQGLLSGIGFIGGGAILKHGTGDVVGIATAATIWNMGAIGAATGFGDYLLAVFLCLGNFLILVLGTVAHRFDAVPDKDAK
jgi:putative Mg2+ transporter-C (MgtC) family protein